MATLFVLLADDNYHGENGETYCISSSFDKSKCERYAEELTARQRFVKAMVVSLRNFQEFWIKENPRVTAPMIHERPKWPPGLKECQITQEMKDERERIKTLNEAVHKEFAEAVAVWQSKFDAAKQQYIIKLINNTALSEEELTARISEIATYTYDTSYYVQEVQFIE